MTGPGQCGRPWRVEKASDSGFILEAGLTGLADAFGLSNWKDGAAGISQSCEVSGLVNGQILRTESPYPL